MLIGPLDRSDSTLPVKNLIVKVGATSLPKSLNGDFIQVKRYFVHESFNRTSLHNDIALLVLEEKIEIGKYVNPVCMPDPELEIKVIGTSKSNTFTHRYV